MAISWKQLLIEADSLTKANGKAAWRTAQIVRELWSRQDFLKEACNSKPDEAEVKLARFSGRFALGLNDMIQMIEHFPSLKEWESGRLDILRDKTCRIVSKRNEKQGASVERRVVTIKEYEALERKYRAAQAEIRRLRTEYEKLLDKIPQLAKVS